MLPAEGSDKLRFVVYLGGLPSWRSRQAEFLRHLNVKPRGSGRINDLARGVMIIILRSS
jgi:hypothetical protein